PRVNVIVFCGYSGSGKTTLIEQLIVRLTLAGQRVCVVKHAHHDFDIDHEGKDSWRHRQAGAFEVVIASNRRLAKMREYPQRAEPTLHQLVAELSDCDWALVEGFKHAALPKIEVWRAATGAPPPLPLFDLNQIDRVAEFMLANAGLCEYPRAPAPAPELATLRRANEP